jgi:hypothetical protein
LNILLTQAILDENVLPRVFRDTVGKNLVNHSNTIYENISVANSLDLYDRELPYINPIVTRAYRYYDTPYIRRDKEGVYRTDRYVKTGIYYTEDSLCTFSRTVHLTEEGVDDVSGRIFYRDIRRASIDPALRSYIIGRKKVTVRYYDLNIYGENGLIFSCQCKNDYTVECAVEDINKLAEKSRA